jgi:hypothetical protein
MSDLELRRLLRAGASDPHTAARLAALVTRSGDREAAIDRWQDVLRLDAAHAEARRRLAELDCDLVFRRADPRGWEVFENTRDGAQLVRPTVPMPDRPERVVMARFGPAELSGLREPPPVFISGIVRGASYLRFWEEHGFDPEVVLGSRRRSWWTPPSVAPGALVKLDAASAERYARWVGGRLPTDEEWEALPYWRSVYGLVEWEHEWVTGTEIVASEPRQHFRSFDEIKYGIYRGTMAADDRAAFRYVRSGWSR